MIPVSSAFKEAMKRPVKELDAYIRIDANNSITSADDLISIKISCDSGMCKAAMRKLEAKYTGEHNLLGQWVHVGFGVKLPSTGTFDYLDYGSFLITEIKTSKDTDVTEIVAYDKMVNAMTKYEELEATYPKGLFAYTQLICQACNLTLGNASFPTNNNWQVTEELWKNISGITYRDILQQIAQATGTTCIIQNDDKVYFKTINATGETLTYDNLFKLKLEPIYGEINSVVLSREPITGEDVYMKDDASILANGLTEFKIDSNQIVDKRREDAITPIYNALHGISYYPFEASTEGLGWYEIGDSFNIINDTNDTFNTTLFNYSITVDGGIKETLKTNAETKTQSQYEYATKTSKRLANAEIIVNKQQNEITELVEATDELQKEIKPTDTTSGSSISLDDSAETELIDFELEGKTEQENEPTPDNPCELVSVGYENLFDKNNANILNVHLSNSTTISGNSPSNRTLYIEIEPNTTYNISKTLSTTFVIGTTENTPTNNLAYYQRQNNSSAKSLTITTNSTAKYLVVWFWNNGDTLTEQEVLDTIQITKGDKAHSYIPYGKYGIEVNTSDSENNTNTYQYILNEPLRSIDNTKDLLYIKNGMLYVERKIGKTILDGTEEWTQTSSQALTNTCYFGSTIIDDQYKENESNVISNYFSQRSLWNNDVEGIQKTSSSSSSSRILRIRIDKTKASTANALKTWLSTHNTEVQYILAEPYTEELGEVQIPSTYKGITYIDTTDELEPNMNITYVRDTLIANYVEQHIAEIKINEEGITQRVESIEESDFGSRINAVEQRIDDDEVNWNVISTHIDRTTGDVREITTSNGMTFNENGLNIHTNQSTFNAQHTYDGTYYRDGEEVITETTISGFKATNLKNKGQHEYSYDDTNDLYEFIDERIEVDGEYCYATFYNGEE